MAATTHHTAQVYRMKTAEHMCPFGLKTVDLLRRKGYAVDDHTLTSREEIDAFKEQENVDTTPQVYIDNQRIGGYEELREHLGMSVPNAKETTYRPVLAIFAIALLIGLAMSWTTQGTLLTARMPEFAVATAMVLLGLQVSLATIVGLGWRVVLAVVVVVVAGFATAVVAAASGVAAAVTATTTRTSSSSAS